MTRLKGHGQNCPLKLAVRDSDGGRQMREKMIELYTAAAPNGWKATIALEELGLDYELHPVDLAAGEQRQESFLRLNPNGRIPVIVDHDGPVRRVIFESGAILLYLAEKTGRLMPADLDGRYEVIQWVMFQMGGGGDLGGSRARASNPQASVQVWARSVELLVSEQAVGYGTCLEGDSTNPRHLSPVP